MADECTLSNIKNATDICSFVTENCDASYINFYSFHFCTLNQNVYLSAPIMIIFGYLLFYLMSHTANRYLSGAVTKLSDTLNFSQNLAGVTFLALGNGAPDVITSLVASGGGETNIEFSIGALLGASAIITCLILSFVIIYGNNIEVTRNMFVRDILFFIISLGYLMFIAVDDKIYLYESIIYLSIYVLYVIVAVIQDYMAKKNQKEEELTKIEENMISEFELKSKNNELPDACIKDETVVNVSSIADVSINTDLKSVKTQKTSDFEVVHHDSMDNNQATSDQNTEENENVTNNSIIEKVLKEQHFIKKEIKVPKQFLRKNRIVSDIINTQYSSFAYRFKRHYLNKDVKFKEMNFISQCFYIIIEIPLTFLRDITIPQCEEENWNQNYVTIMPFTCLLFILAVLNSFVEYFTNPILICCTLIPAICLCVLIRCTTYRGKLPKWILIVAIVGFIMSIFWIYMTANMIVDIISTFGVMFDIPTNFLALTVLAFANSIGDISLARTGYGEMATSGCIAGPLFNNLFGMGLSLIKVNFMSSYVSIKLFSKSHLNLLIVIGFLILNMIALLISSCILSVAISGFIIYPLCLIGIVYSTFFYK